MTATTSSKTESIPMRLPHIGPEVVAATTEALKASWPGVLRQPGEAAYDD